MSERENIEIYGQGGKLTSGEIRSQIAAAKSASPERSKRFSKPHKFRGIKFPELARKKGTKPEISPRGRMLDIISKL